MEKIYIFVLCPPLHGSTIITNLLNSSLNVSSFIDFNDTWAGESQWYYKKMDLNYENNRWDPNYKLDMNMVNRVFNEYLDNNKKIWVEKSPPIICRAKMYEDYFSKLGKVYFIISIRNPYSVNSTASEWIKYSEYQKWNIENLQNTIILNYEEICTNLDNVINKIKNKIPELGDIYSKSHISKNNERFQIIHQDKVNRILNKDDKNILLKDHIELLEFFNYKID